MTRPQKVVLWCAAIAAGAVALFPPLCLIDDSDSAHINCYFLFRLPPLDIGSFLWPITLFLMLAEWLSVFVLAFFAYRMAGRYNKPVLESSPWSEPQNDNPTVWPPPPSV